LLVMSPQSSDTYHTCMDSRSRQERDGCFRKLCTSHIAHCTLHIALADADRPRSPPHAPPAAFGVWNSVGIRLETSLPSPSIPVTSCSTVCLLYRPRRPCIRGERITDVASPLLSLVLTYAASVCSFTVYRSSVHSSSSGNLRNNGPS